MLQHPYVFMVKSLINSSMQSWNEELIQQLFNPRDVHEIMQIPLLNVNKSDEIIWRFDKRGLYTVKSAYWTCMERLINRDELKVEGEWHKLWSIAVSAKVRTFLWRVARNCLPHRENLRSRGVDCTTQCVCCDFGFENNWHLFLVCLVSVACWKQINSWPVLEPFMLDAEGFTEFFMQILKVLNNEQIESFDMTIWGLWKRRNVLLWHDITESVDTVIAIGDYVLRSWQQAQKNAPHGSILKNSTVVRWNPPQPGFVKCNVDAAIFEQQGSTGIGLCVRDEEGQFIMARTDWWKNKMSVCEAESWGLLHAIKWMITVGFHDVIFEMDSKQVVEDVRIAKSNRSEYESILDECQSLLSCYNNFQVVFTRRQANGSVHALARASISYATRSDFHYIPGCIVGIICNEMS